MSALGHRLIDDTVHETNAWLNRLDALTGWGDKNRAYRLLRATLHAIRDHLGVNECADLGAQLPTLIRGIYYEGFHPAKQPVKERTKAGFVAQVQKAFETDPMGDAEEAIGAVFRLLSEHVSPGEMEDVTRSFTMEIRQLIPG
jgi:uncharacterized protein (DUF2267 family)